MIDNVMDMNATQDMCIFTDQVFFMIKESMTLSIMTVKALSMPEIMPVSHRSTLKFPEYDIILIKDRDLIDIFAILGTDNNS